MISPPEINQIISQYGRDILDEPKRVYAILIDWHPRQKVSFDEVCETCRKWKNGEIPLATVSGTSPFSTMLEKAKSLVRIQGKPSKSVPVGGCVANHVDGSMMEVEYMENKQPSEKKAGKNKTMKPTINTNPIDIKIDTSKSFRGGVW